MPTLFGIGLALATGVLFGLRTTRLEFTRRPTYRTRFLVGSSPWFLALLWLFLLTVSFIDLLTPPELAVTSFYLLPVALGAMVRMKPRLVLHLSVAATILIAAGAVFDLEPILLLRQGVNLIVLWIVTSVVLTWQKKLGNEEVLRDRIASEREMLGDALKAVPAGVVVCFDPLLDRIIGNERLYEIFRVPPHQGISFSPSRTASFWFEQRGQPLPLSFTPLYQAMLKGEICENQEMNLVFPDGVRRTIVASARPLFSQEKLVGAVACVQDITERAKLEARLNDERLKLDAVLRTVPVGILVCDSEGCVVLSNPKSNQLAGLSLDGLCVLDYLQTAQLKERDQTIRPEEILERIRAGREVRDLEYLGRQPNGATVHFLVNVSPLQNGCIIGFVDITERQQLENRLREALSMRDRFLAVVGHELRNPLTPILGWTEVLKKDVTLKENLRKATISIERNTLQLSTLVHDLLDLARIQNHKLEIKRSEVDLRDIAEHAVDSMLKAASQRRLTLRFVSEASGPLRIFADPQRMHQVMLNLIDNAVKFTPPGGTVTVRVRSDASVSVEDTGIGIPRSFLPKVFEIFSQSDDLPSQRRRGLGIGLSLVKSIIERHGGTVRAESEGEGKGAQFIVSLPLAEAGLSSARHQDPAGRHLRCLVIDDDDDTLQTLQAMLESLGYEAETAVDGAAGIQKAIQNPPNVILSDLSMPTLDGYGVLRQARINPKLSEIPIVAVSGLGMPEDRQRTRDAGFAGHLTKPVSLDQLESTLRDVTSPVTLRT